MALSGFVGAEAQAQFGASGRKVLATGAQTSGRRNRK